MLIEQANQSLEFKRDSMIEFILISTQNGIPILLRNYTPEKEINDQIISGFFSAIDFFSRETMHSPIQQVQLKNRYITFWKETFSGNNTDINFLLVSKHCLGFERQEECICVPSTLKSIATEFKNRYQGLDFKGVIHTKAFREFYDYIDLVVERHFQTHFCNNNFVAKFISSESGSNAFLGYVSFKDGILNNFDLRTEMITIRYRRLMGLVNEWRKILGTENSTLEWQISEFRDFKVVISTFITEKSEIIHFFTFWERIISNDLMHRLHEAVIASLT
ncbi:MAG: hypothetical protein ACFFD4_10930 [Candidatus Odinarchaeota archaeon]